MRRVHPVFSRIPLGYYLVYDSEVVSIAQQLGADEPIETGGGLKKGTRSGHSERKQGKALMDFILQVCSV